MVNDKVNIDFGADLEENCYKSYFARSMAVNSQYKESNCLDFRQLQRNEPAVDNKGCYSNQKNLGKSLHPPEVVRLRKDHQTKSDDGNRLSWDSSNSSRRASFSSNRISEIPVENFFMQSQIDTLQWQLKETESSREMYRAVMRQIVTFLEKAHRSLELLGSRINTQRVTRTQSEFFMNSTLNDSSFNETIIENTNTLNGPDNTFREYSWMRPKKEELLPDEIPPQKLSQEAFRLLRTAQSLLSTHEPDLAHVNSNSEEDLDFLTQLAKEFPADIKPHRTTSFSLSPKLLTPEKEIKVSTAFNRKLSLQLNDNLRRNSFLKDVSSKLNRSTESSRSSVAESVDCILSSTLIDDGSVKSLGKFKYEKSHSPPVSSVGSAEDESGFSSMNSFQEVGLPTVCNDDPKEALLKSMLHNNSCHNDFYEKDNLDDIKLWQTPGNVIHKRWSSTPVENCSPEKTTLNVLWV